MKATQKKQSTGAQPTLPPELLERLERMARHNRQNVDQELAGIVSLAWVRFVGKANEGQGKNK